MYMVLIDTNLFSEEGIWRPVTEVTVEDIPCLLNFVVAAIATALDVRLDVQGLQLSVCTLLDGHEKQHKRHKREVGYLCSTPRDGHRVQSKMYD